MLEVTTRLKSRIDSHRPYLAPPRAKTSLSSSPVTASAATSKPSSAHLAEDQANFRGGRRSSGSFSESVVAKPSCNQHPAGFSSSACRRLCDGRKREHSCPEAAGAARREIEDTRSRLISPGRDELFHPVFAERISTVRVVRPVEVSSSRSPRSGFLFLRSE